MGERLERGRDAASEYHQRRWPHEKAKLKFIIAFSVAAFFVMWIGLELGLIR